MLPAVAKRFLGWITVSQGCDAMSFAGEEAVKETGLLVSLLTGSGLPVMNYDCSDCNIEVFSCKNLTLKEAKRVHSDVIELKGKKKPPC